MNDYLWKGALLYGATPVCALRDTEQPGHLNVRAVLRHYVPKKGLYPLRRFRLSSYSKKRDHFRHAFCQFNCLTNTQLKPCVLLDGHIPGTVLTRGFRGALRGDRALVNQGAVSVILGFIGAVGSGRLSGRLGRNRGRHGGHLRCGEHGCGRGHSGVPVGAAAARQHRGGKDEACE